MRIPAPCPLRIISSLFPEAFRVMPPPPPENTIEANPEKASGDSIVQALSVELPFSHTILVAAGGVNVVVPGKVIAFGSVTVPVKVGDVANPGLG
jgi:hypothetical protein